MPQKRLALLKTGKLRHKQHTYLCKGHTKCAAYVKHVCLWTAGGISPGMIWFLLSILHPHLQHAETLRRKSGQKEGPKIRVLAD